jgi:hypothetical protein
MLTTVARLRHGGTIAVIPPPGHRLIEVKYPAASRAITETLDRFYREWVEALDQGDGADGIRAIGRFEATRHSLLTIAEACGGLTATDGCVVLDTSMRLLGLGGSSKPRRNDWGRCWNGEAVHQTPRSPSG